jgi:hypothetical protein
MATRKTIKKTKSPNADSDTGVGLHALADTIEGVGEELRPLYHLAAVADNLGSLSSALDGLANATALAAIAQYGSSEDRTTAVALLKSRIERFE